MSETPSQGHIMLWPSGRLSCICNGYCYRIQTNIHTSPAPYICLTLWVACTIQDNTNRHQVAIPSQLDQITPRPACGIATIAYLLHSPANMLSNGILCRRYVFDCTLLVSEKRFSAVLRPKIERKTTAPMTKIGNERVHHLRTVAGSASSTVARPLYWSQIRLLLKFVYKCQWWILCMLKIANFICSFFLSIHFFFKYIQASRASARRVNLYMLNLGITLCSVTALT